MADRLALRRLLRQPLFWVAVLYFAEGLPFGLFADVFPVEWREAGWSLGEIGLLGLTGLAWTFKFLWAPAIDSLRHHRRWMAAADGLMALLMVMAARHTPSFGATLVTVTAFTLLSATNDIAIDGYTIDILTDQQMGLANGLRIGFYRVGLMAAGIVLIVSTWGGWTVAHWVMAGLLVGDALLCLAAPFDPPRGSGAVDGRTELAALARAPAALALIGAIGLSTVALARRATHHGVPSWLVVALVLLFGIAFATRRKLAGLDRGAIFGGFADLVARPDMGRVFLFVLTYKLSETAMAFMVKPFWVDAGFSAAEIGLISVNAGIALSIVGGLVGGWVTDRIGIVRALWIFGVVQALPNLVYAAAAAGVLHGAPPGGGERLLVFGASAAESFTSGLGTTAFLAALMAMVDRRHSATEFAVLSSVFALSRGVAAVVSGFGASRFGYSHYFFWTFFAAFPAYLFLPAVRRVLARHAQMAGESAVTPDTVLD